MRNKTGTPEQAAGAGRRRAAAGGRDRGSVTIEQLMWGLFWLGVITAAGLVVGPWIAAKVASIIAY